MSFQDKQSYGPVIGVLAVIFVLGVISAIVGRLCSGRTVFGYGHFDVEGWLERKCASCVAGRVVSPGPPPPPPEAAAPAANGGGGGEAAQGSKDRTAMSEP